MPNYPLPSVEAVNHASECYRTYQKHITGNGRQPTPDELQHLGELRRQCMLTEKADLWRKGIVRTINRGSLNRWDEMEERAFIQAYGDLFGLTTDEQGSAA